MGTSIKKLLKNGKIEANVGFFSDKMHKTSSSTKNFSETFNLKKPSAPISVAFLAQILNNGYFNHITGGLIPGRPFMDTAKQQIKANIKNIIIEALKSDNPQEKLNDIIKSYIQSAMTDFSYASNTELTESFKNIGNNPLIDDGELYNSIEAR